MRRKDRQINDFMEIYDIIKRCDICRIALNNDGYPYILPLNFGVSSEDEKLTFYFHSALEGQKLQLIEKDNRALKWTAVMSFSILRKEVIVLMHMRA